MRGFCFASSLFLFAFATACAGDAGRWDQLAALPDAHGVAAPFAGVSGDALLVAGGANFPAGMPWEGGRKAWADAVWMLAEPRGAFREAGKLTRPLAYGVSVTAGPGVICAGGCDADRHYPDVFQLAWKAGRIEQEELPPLPIPLAYASGALAGGKLYVACGTDEPGEKRASNRVFVLDLAAERLAWRELPPLPGKPRLLAIAASANGAFHVLGGVALEERAAGKREREYLQDAWRYHAGTGWERLPDLPRAVAAAPSPAPVWKGKIFVIGGDDGSRRDFQPLEKHPGFVPAVFAFDLHAARWSEVEPAPVARATVPVVEWAGAFIIPSGETRPGVRSPEVWRFTPAR